ncbi:uncharacterized protein CELE_T05C12.11 [Caenorhabditis elegans]|uniref:Uncharacterized protein n=1 Tax=Caenorhabditis elegans TaxID=6239 RepID=A0A2C9C3B6_CAEEL|nr:Uncharacterized protein CELE_T05C12.11 [Caenorhabditis elegans]SOF58773.1 Uncharacterized protein CELE_T05C12.11 [Caenorhabditis elegans]|eukprot:NP_001343781.1 Uncharacterized protein CELE_T05C12.11 [Caenorhabditis elegans]
MIILILLLFNVVLSTDVIQEKLIRVNEWHDIPVKGTEDEDALIDFHLFATCEKFSVLFMTEPNESTRFEFSYYDVTLKKIDVQSIGNAVQVPVSPKMLGTCRENNRKILRIKIRTSNDTITFKVDDQIIRRPFDSTQNNIKILIPQKVACCLIRALFLNNSDLDAYTSVSTRFFTSSKSSYKRILEVFGSTSSSLVLTTTPSTSTSRTTTKNDTNKWSKFTLGKNPTVSSSTSEPKMESSWTHAVNKEWSITFVLCSVIVCTIMLFLAVFGTFTVFYLMTKPRGGKSPFAVDA